MQKILNYFYIAIFGRYTLDGFADKNFKCKRTYTFDSIFPDVSTMKTISSINNNCK